MDINKNYQINTFIKGMDTDTSDMYLEDSLYRMAENVRLLTNTDSNSGELHLIEGTTLYDVKFYKKEGDQENEISEDIWEDSYILATDSVRNIGIVILKKEDTWSIYKIDFNTDKGYLLFGPCTEPIWTDTWENEKQISTVTRWESDTNVKLYITDSTESHTLMIMQIADNTYIGNDFYDAFPTNSVLLDPPSVEISSEPGNLKSGIIMYAYRFYTESGDYTSISPLSSKLVTYNTKYSGYLVNEQSNKSINVSITNINTSLFLYIQLFRILYSSSSEIPEIQLIIDQAVGQKTFSYNDKGSDIKKDITYEEFLSLQKTKIIPKHIESKEDYLFAANVKYAQDQVDTKFKDFDARCYSPGMKLSSNGTNENIITADWDNIKTEDIILPEKDSNGCTVWNKADWTFYYSDSLGVIDITDENILDRDTNTKYMKPGWDAYVNGVGKRLCWRYVYEDIPDDALKANNLTGFVNKSTSTFRSEEVYRFGIRLYDERGTASSVKWIADITMPKITETCSGRYRNVGILFSINNYYDNWWKDWNGISAIEIVRCNRTIEDKCTITQGIVGFPYVTNFGSGTGIGSYLIPIHYMSLLRLNFSVPRFVNEFDTNDYLGGNPQTVNDQYWATVNKDLQRNFLTSSLYPRLSVLMFASPEYSYLQDDVKNILKKYESNIRIYPSHKLNVFTDRFDYSMPNLYEVDGYNSWTYNVIAANNHGGLGHPYWGIVIDSENLDLPTVVTPFIYYSRNSGPQNLLSTPNGDNADNATFFRYNYIETVGTPKEYSTNSSNEIKEIQYIDAPSTKSPLFSDVSGFTFFNDSVAIGSETFINWVVVAASIGASMSHDQMSLTAGWKAGDSIPNLRNTIWQFPIGSGGSCILLNTKTQINIELPNDSSLQHCFPSVYVQNIRKAANPYGGINGVETSIYTPHGDYHILPPFNSGIPVLANVFSGDTKLRAYSYNSSHNFENQFHSRQMRMGTTYVVPMECDIDILAQAGTLFGVDGETAPWVQDDVYSMVTVNYLQTKPAYKDVYNPLYSAELSPVTYSEKQDLKNKNSTYDTRVIYTAKKENNNEFDDWSNFQILNFLDVDSRYGEITGLKLFKNKLIFWQERAAGTLSVNERIALGDTNGNEIVLGHGSTLERFDYITTTYGLQKNTRAYDVSENYLYWWDEHNKEILQVSEKDQLVPLSTTKHIRNYINESSDGSKIPSIIYDNQYKEILCNIKKDESVVYNEFVDKFTAVYKFDPVFKILNEGNIYLSSNAGPLYKYNFANELDNTSSLFENEIFPFVKYIINKNPQQIKVYDTLEIGGRFYSGGEVIEKFEGLPYKRVNTKLSPLKFVYKTPLKQSSETSGNKLSNIEYAYKLAIPRNGQNESNNSFDTIKEYGNRMRGNTMLCEFKSTSNDLDFSLQYITTKFRISWT